MKFQAGDLAKTKQFISDTNYPGKGYVGKLVKCTREGYQGYLAFEQFPLGGFAPGHFDKFNSFHLEPVFISTEELITESDMSEKPKDQIKVGDWVEVKAIGRNTKTASDDYPPLNHVGQVLEYSGTVWADDEKANNLKYWIVSGYPEGIFHPSYFENRVFNHFKKVDPVVEYPSVDSGFEI